MDKKGQIFFNKIVTVYIQNVHKGNIYTEIYNWKKSIWVKSIAFVIAWFRIGLWVTAFNYVHVFYFIGPELGRLYSKKALFIYLFINENY